MAVSSVQLLEISIAYTDCLRICESGTFDYKYSRAQSKPVVQKSDWIPGGGQGGEESNLI